MRLHERKPITKVYAPCSYTWDNKGDAALAIAMYQSLYSEFEGRMSITFSSLTPEADSKAYGMKFVEMPLARRGLVEFLVRVFRKLTRAYNVVSMISMIRCAVFLILLRVWFAAYTRRGDPALRLLPRRTRAVIREILDADICAAVPGGYLKAAKFHHDGWFFHMVGFMSAKVLGKPVVLFPVSIGPVAKGHKRIASSVFNQCDLIMVREEISRGVLLELNVPSHRIKVVPDSAFLLEIDQRGEFEYIVVEERLKDLPKPWIGISARYFDFPDRPDSEKAFEQYLESFATVADELIRHTSGSIVFVPQFIGNQYLDDVAVSHRILQRMVKPQNAVVIEDDLSPQGLKRLYSNFDLLVGTRMHANILALGAGTPVVGVAYEHKTVGIMATMGLSDYVVPIDCTTKELRRVTFALWNNRLAVKEKIIGRLPSTIEDASKAAHYTAEVAAAT